MKNALILSMVLFSSVAHADALGDAATLIVIDLTCNFTVEEDARNDTFIAAINETGVKNVKQISDMTAARGMVIYKQIGDVDRWCKDKAEFLLDRGVTLNLKEKLKPK